MPRTEDEVAEAISASLRILEATSVPEDLRSLAFEKAFAALTASDPGVDGQGASRPAAHPGAKEDGQGSAIGRVASKLGLDPTLVDRVLDFDEDGVHITVPRSRFAKQKSAAIHQVASVVVAARQAAGLEEWTPQSVVRQATEALGVEDPSNFATYMKKLKGIRARGSGRSGELKMNAVGFEAAAVTIRQLAEEGTR